MQKKIEKLRRLVQELSARYGNDDVDVLRIQTEMRALEAITPTPLRERRKATPDKRNFQSASRQIFDATRPGDLH